MKRILFLFLLLPGLAYSQTAKDTVNVLSDAEIAAGTAADTVKLYYIQGGSWKKSRMDSIAKYTRVKLVGDKGDITVSGSFGETWSIDAGAVVWDDLAQAVKDSIGAGGGGGGGVTSITAGTGLTGGTIVTSGTIAADTNFLVTVNDTAAMLTNYINVVDTATMLSTYINAADTASMLTNYINVSDTAAMLLTYINAADTAAMLSTYINTSDTAAMLLTYINAADTAAMLATYINFADTAAMLSTYISAADTAAMLTTYINASDTAAMLLTYINAADTAAMLSTYAKVGSGGVGDGDKGDITVSGGGATWTIDSAAVTGAKTNFEGRAGDATRLLGAQTNGTTDTVQVGAGLTLSGGVLRSKSDTLAMIIAASDETTALTQGNAKVTFRAPFAMRIVGVRANVNTASTSGTPTIDINDTSVSILSTLLTIDVNQKTSVTATTAAVIDSSKRDIGNDDEITIDIDTAGTGTKGLKITIYYIR